MKFGIAITNAVNPAVEAKPQAEYAKRMAVASEESGFDSVWVVERTVFPVDITRRYPEMFGPHHSKPESQHVLEPMVTLSYVAGITSKVILGFSVLILPFRNPVLNTKMLTTLDMVSDGRAVFGIGVGWMPEEFESMGARFDARATVTDEHIEMYQALCSQDVAEYQGQHFKISGQVFFPKPIQKPYPPIWVGGKTGAAIKRAARYGDAWNPLWVTIDEFPGQLKQLQDLTESFDRPRNAVTPAMTINMHWGEAQFDANGRRMELTGTTQQLVDDLRAYRDIGLEHVIISPSADSTNSTLDQIKRFATEVMPKI